MPSPTSGRTPAGVRSRSRQAARRGFNRSRLFRRLLGAGAPGHGLDLSHLAWYPEADAIGPVQREEALLLFALTRVMRPRVVVEVGFSRGRSALNFLLALPPEAHLYSFDIDEESERIATGDFAAYPNFTFRRRSQDEITAADVDHRPIDLVFLDGSHELARNRETFARLAPLLAPQGLFAIHDTGVWGREHFLPAHAAYGRDHPRQWISDEEYEHRPEERAFVNWIAHAHPEFGRLQLETAHTLRHGMTILQRQAPLATCGDEAGTA